MVTYTVTCLPEGSVQKVLHPVPKRTVKAMAAFFLEAAVHGPEASGCCGAFSEGWASWGLTQERRRRRSSKPSRAGVKDCHRSPGARPRVGGFPESKPFVPGRWGPAPWGRARRASPAPGTHGWGPRLTQERGASLTLFLAGWVQWRPRCVAGVPTAATGHHQMWGS